jgi:hypothetical protein
MAQVTLGKFFSGVPKFDGEGGKSIIKILIFIIAVSYDYSHAYDQLKSTNLKLNYCFNIKT